ncbi:MAG TPA: hypothetical protein VKG80_21855 [Trebonia sp.]|nr:hypothetical protein [Trebonia sp.]
MTGHQSGPTGAGSVILDLGGSVGALILATPPELHGQEIEISPADGGAGTRRTHAMVRRRETGAGSSYAAVYPGLAAGAYTVWRTASTPAGTIVVEGGQVTRFSLR